MGLGLPDGGHLTHGYYVRIYVYVARCRGVVLLLDQYAACTLIRLSLSLLNGHELTHVLAYRLPRRR